MAIAAPSALAANTAKPNRPSVVKPAPQQMRHGKVIAQNKSTNRHDKGNDRQGRPDSGQQGHGAHGKPPYPPGRDCSVSIDAPNRSRRGQTVKISTKVTYNRHAISGVKVALYISTRHGGWKLVSTTTTNNRGDARFSYTVKRDTLVRVVVAGGKGGKAAQSETVKISVKR
jgi:hypothetical protein